MTIVVLAMVALLMVALLVLVTIAQMLYMDSVRVRARDITFLELFREEISNRVGLKADQGILTFSLIKHSLLALLGVVCVAILLPEEYASAAIAEAAVFTWFTMLLACYVVPQLLYRRTTGRWFVPLIPLIKGVALLVVPLTATLAFLQSLAQLGVQDTHEGEATTAGDNIDALIDAGAEEGILEEEDRKLIQSVVAFGDKTVREVMTPRPSIVTIAAEDSLEELRQLVIHEQYSRIPVYEDSIDNMVGFVHVRDMFELDAAERVNRKVREIARPVRSVPETKAVNDLLREMQSEGAHMAIVIDEYGSTAGLVTMEDMVEEIVGEIRDEHEPATDIVPDASGGFVLSGSFDVDHLDELVGYRRNEETESTTVGGLATEWLGRVPAVGEHVERDGIRIDILGANELRVEQVRVSRIQQVTHGINANINNTNAGQ